ncbi:MAG: MarR family transcriptional regulator [Gemmatimonadales bacterium]|nr:MAG: MarR family transcriptional regulator [Gemmatimonadales bacterium]
MHPAAQTFIEKMGLHFEGEGLPRTAGRVLGLLMLRSEPASLEEISEALQVSKASSSTNCRLLERGGMADRVSLPGDRRDYYQVDPNMTERMLDAARRKVGTLLEIMEEARTSLPEDMHSALRRVEELHDFHTFLHHELGALHERWRVRRIPGNEATRADLGEEA